MSSAGTRNLVDFFFFFPFIEIELTMSTAQARSSCKKFIKDQLYGLDNLLPPKVLCSNPSTVKIDPGPGAATNPEPGISPILTVWGYLGVKDQKKKKDNETTFMHILK